MLPLPTYYAGAQQVTTAFSLKVHVPICFRWGGVCDGVEAESLPDQRGLWTSWSLQIQRVRSLIDEEFECRRWITK